jgi:co-chaperonin GroES (HSP10)
MNGVFIPSTGKLLIKRTPKITEKNGFAIPANSMEIPHDGVIVSTPWHTAETPCPFHSGDHIFYAVHTDEEIIIDEEQFFLVRVEHVHGILTR